jgi:hypothetical protein
MMVGSPPRAMIDRCLAMLLPRFDKTLLISRQSSIASLDSGFSPMSKGEKIIQSGISFI